MTTQYFIGTSGWHYRYWQGPFYPSSLPATGWLAYYARHLATVEINASFYRLPSLHTARAWKTATPADFRFALKASRYITHRKKLRVPRASLRPLFAVLRALGRKAGPLLFQLPPRWRCNPGRLAAFLKLLPAGREVVFELRDRSWHKPEIYALLKRHNVAYCIYDLAGFSSPPVVTADFAYVRLHGPTPQPYAGCYSDAALAAWAERIRGWKQLRRTYVYFDNDEAAYAVQNAMTLRALLAGATNQETSGR